MRRLDARNIFVKSFLKDNHTFDEQASIILTNEILPRAELEVILLQGSRCGRKNKK